MIETRMPRPTTTQVLPLASSYYHIHPDNACGGSLHIVLDDDNVEDGHIDWCITHARTRGDRAGELLGQVLRRMSKTQRAVIAKRHTGGRYLGNELSEAELIAVCERLLQD